MQETFRVTKWFLSLLMSYFFKSKKGTTMTIREFQREFIRFVLKVNPKITAGKAGRLWVVWYREYDRGVAL
jgi:hypothetical protein